MRKFWFLIGIIFLFQCANAAPVDPATAAKVATNFYRQCAVKSGAVQQKSMVALSDVTSQTPYQNIFVFNEAHGNGFVLVAGDDRSIPILGYSTTGTFDYASLTDNARNWIEHYEQEIASIQKNNAAPYENTAAEWESMMTGTYTASKGTVVAPLIQTEWGQSVCNDDLIAVSDGYNKFCPYDNAAKSRAVTGCVATAMAQIMKYWNWPEKGKGSYSYTHPSYGKQEANFGQTEYDWDNMPVALLKKSTDAQVNAVATLIYHCGVAVNMNYGVSGSGAYDEDAASALKSYFRYTSTMIKKSVYSNSSWISALKTELDNGRPVYYSGCNSNREYGHAFVCDGYDDNNMFHFNWGWNGKHHGFFAVTDLTPNNYDFSYYQTCIAGISPNRSAIPDADYDLIMNTSLSSNARSYKFGEAITISYQVVNRGPDDFNGQIVAAMFDAADNKQVDLQIVDESINAGYYIRNSVTFKGKYPPGTYYVRLFCGTDPNNLSQYALVQETIIRKNSVQFSVKSFSMSVETYSVIANNAAFKTGEKTNVTVNVANTGTDTFYGDVGLIITDASGKNLQTLATKSVSGGIPTQKYNSIVFSGDITVKAGNYFMALVFKNQDDTTWYYAGSTYYNNPVKITISKAPMSPDEYEPNNTVATAYELGTVQSKTKSFNVLANLHITNDIDYYKIVLPEGYNYTVSAQMNDSYNSSYTAFATMNVLLDGTTTIGKYNNEMAAKTIKNGGTLYFKLAGYNGNENDIGTYQLVINITRTANTGIEDVEETHFALYPNPAQDKINLDIPENVVVEQLDVITLNGQVVRSFDKNDRVLNVGDLSSGAYLLRIRTQDAVVTKKWIKR